MFGLARSNNHLINLANGFRFCIVCTVFFVSFRLRIFILICFVCTSVRTTPPSDDPIAVSNNNIITHLATWLNSIFAQGLLSYGMWHCLIPFRHLAICLLDFTVKTFLVGVPWHIGTATSVNSWGELSWEGYKVFKLVFKGAHMWG